jgi:glycogen(starch) synthase
VAYICPGAGCRLKLLYWSERIWPEIGGIETFIRQLMEGMDKRGHEVAVVSSSFSTASKEIDSELGFTIWRYPFADAFKKRDLRDIKKISVQVSQLVQTFQPTLIHLNTFLTSSFYYLRIPKSLRPPTLLTLHSGIKETQAARQLRQQIIQDVDFVVGVSKATLQDYIHVYPDLASRSAVIYNGVNMLGAESQPLCFEKPVILGLGRLNYEKGFDIALQAFKIVTEKFQQAKFILAGDGEERSMLEVQAQKLGIADQVNFIGYIKHNHVPELINQATMVIIPSRHEQFGIVALEAGQLARPVIASRVGGLQEIIIHQQTGLLVNPADSTELAQSIFYLLNNHDIAKRYGYAAKKRVESYFSMQQFIEKYERVYYNIANISKVSSRHS